LVFGLLLFFFRPFCGFCGGLGSFFGLFFQLLLALLVLLVLLVLPSLLPPASPPFSGGVFYYTTRRDHHVIYRPVLPACLHALHLPNHLHPSNDAAEDHVLAIQMRGRLEGDEKLRAVGIGAGVCHGEHVGLVVFRHEVFVLEFAPVDALAARAIAFRKIPALCHEARDDAVKLAALQVQRLALRARALFASAQCEEVGGGFGHNVCKQLNLDPARFEHPDLDVEEHLGKHSRVFKISYTLVRPRPLGLRACPHPIARRHACRRSRALTKRMRGEVALCVSSSRCARCADHTNGPPVEQPEEHEPFYA
jgi:hypothetical protein